MNPDDRRGRGRTGDGRSGDRKGGRRPVGIERASRTAGAPPRQPQPKATERRVPKPELPKELEVDLPKGVIREIKRQVRGADEREDVLRAMTLAAAALDDEVGETAVPYLVWAKDVAPRAPSVRESLGIALYLTEDYAAALTELQTYRRFAGKPDQNHVIADCLRALGRGTDRIPELVEEMMDAAPPDRVTEGVIVWGSYLADRGDLDAGRAVVRRRVETLDRDESEVEEHHLRLWYVAGDLAERDGDLQQARAFFQRISDHVEGFFDTEERLEALDR